MRHSHSAPTTIIAARTLLAVAIVAGTLAGAALSQQARVFSLPEASAVPPSADVSFVRLSSAAAGLNFSSPSSDRSVLSPHRPVIKTTTPNEGTCECIRVPFGADIISSAWPQAHAADPTPPAAYSDIPFAALSAERDRQGTFPTPAGFPYADEIGVIAEAAAANGIQSVEDWYILLAIRCAENGRDGRQFGVLDPRAIDTSLRTQAGWAAATVSNNRHRYQTALEAGHVAGREVCPADRRVRPGGPAAPDAAAFIVFWRGDTARQRVIRSGMRTGRKMCPIIIDNLRRSSNEGQRTKQN